MFNIPGKYIVTIFVAAVIIALLFVGSVRKWLAIRFKTFDYLWDYIEAAYAHLNDIFWGVAVTGAAFAIPFFIIGIVSQFT